MAAATIARAAAAARGSGDAPLELCVAAVQALARMSAPGGPRRGLELVRGALDEVGDGPLPAVLARLLGTVELRLLAAAHEDREAEAALAAAPPCVATSVLAARRALAVGDTEAARDLLEPVLDQSEEPADTASRIEALVVYAVACRAQLDRDVAGDALERALELADHDRFVWVFLQAGPPLRDLLTRQIRRGTSHRGLVEALSVELERDATTARPAPLLEPLSEREQRVLSYLETMLSTEEIAGELFVSTNTVKSHVKSIYRKLGVTRRRQAVVRARTLQLL